MNKKEERVKKGDRKQRKRAPEISASYGHLPLDAVFFSLPLFTGPRVRSILGLPTFGAPMS
jgi:hypothetical protein